MRLPWSLSEQLIIPPGGNLSGWQMRIPQEERYKSVLAKLEIDSKFSQLLAVVGSRMTYVYSMSFDLALPDGWLLLTHVRGRKEDPNRPARSEQGSLQQTDYIVCTYTPTITRYNPIT